MARCRSGLHGRSQPPGPLDLGLSWSLLVRRGMSRAWSRVPAGPMPRDLQQRCLGARPGARSGAGPTLLKCESAAELAATLARSMPDVCWAVETGIELLSGPGWGYDFSGEGAHRRVDQIAALWAEPLVKVLGWSDRRSADELVAAVRSFGLVDVEPTHSGGPVIVELSAAAVTKAGALAKLCAG